MLIVRTPYRVSFAGGGSDLLSYSLIYGGSVVGCAINQHVTLNYDSGSIVNKSLLEQCSGLGGSAAYYAGITRLANPSWTKERIINHITEQEKLGQQDQILTVLGGLRSVTFNTDGTWSTKPIHVPEWLNHCMSLHYMGEREKEGRTYLTGINEKALHEQVTLSVRLADTLVRENFEDFIDAIQEAWLIKKSFRKDIVTGRIRDFERTCSQKGILALKLCGAGGGGYAVLFREPHSNSLIGIPISVDMSGQVVAQVS